MNSVTLDADGYDIVDAVEEEYRFINVGEARRHGQMPKANWDKLPRELKKFWLKFPINTREDILTCLLPPPPPSISEEHRLPGTGVSSRNARATNAVETETVPEDPNATERSVNMGYISAMRARSAAAIEDQDRDPRLLSRNAFEPAKLMSRQNKSSKQLVPIDRGNGTKQRNVSLSNISSTSFLTPELLSNVIPENRSVNMAITTGVSDLDAAVDIEFSNEDGCHLALVDGGANTGLANPGTFADFGMQIPQDLLMLQVQEATRSVLYKSHHSPRRLRLAKEIK